MYDWATISPFSERMQELQKIQEGHQDQIDTSNLAIESMGLGMEDLKEGKERDFRIEFKSMQAMGKLEKLREHELELRATCP